jgi:hypothetical protein
MPLYDLRNNINILQTLAPATRTATATGGSVDTGPFNSAVVEFSAGAITDGTHTPSVEVSDDNSIWTAVANADLQGELSALSANSVQRVGYVGGGRYIRGVVTVAGATSGGVSGANVILGHPATGPVA